MAEIEESELLNPSHLTKLYFLNVKPLEPLSKRITPDSLSDDVLNDKKLESKSISNDLVESKNTIPSSIITPKKIPNKDIVRRVEKSKPITSQITMSDIKVEVSDDTKSELTLVKKENIMLKNEINSLKAELTNVQTMIQRSMLEVNKSLDRKLRDYDQIIAVLKKRVGM
jgi:hypothetical protein